MGDRGDIILIPTSRQHRLCELLMDWAVLVIDSPENKCLHVHKSSVDSTASQLTGALAWEGRSSSSPLQTPPAVNLVCPSRAQDVLLPVPGEVQLQGQQHWGQRGHKGVSDLGMHKCGARALWGAPCA